eukprot:Tamp_05134.p1 GENE.Tamp_05134~~Tamp_05134.p1  ORF type:complete len:810 (+),score=62.45 Tamp_05134:41-2431(+)
MQADTPVLRLDCAHGFGCRSDSMGPRRRSWGAPARAGSTCLAYNSEGVIIYSASSLAVLQAGDRQIGYFDLHRANISALTIDTSRTFVATVELGSSSPIKIWRSKCATLHKNLVRDTSQDTAEIPRCQDAAPTSSPSDQRTDVISMGFNPGARLLVALESDPTHTVSIYDCAKGTLITSHPALVDPRDGLVLGVSCSPSHERDEAVRFVTYGVKHIRFWMVSREDASSPQTSPIISNGGSVRKDRKTHSASHHHPETHSASHQHPVRKDSGAKWGPGEDRSWVVLHDSARHQGKAMDSVAVSCEFLPADKQRKARNMTEEGDAGENDMDNAAEVESDEHDPPHLSLSWAEGQIVTGMSNGTVCVWTRMRLTKIISHVHAGPVTCIKAVTKEFVKDTRHHHLSTSSAQDTRQFQERQRGRTTVGLITGGEDGRIKIYSLADFLENKSADCNINVGAITVDHLHTEHQAAKEEGVRDQRRDPPPGTRPHQQGVPYLDDRVGASKFGGEELHRLQGVGGLQRPVPAILSVGEDKGVISLDAYPTVKPGYRIAVGTTGGCVYEIGVLSSGEHGVSLQSVRLRVQGPCSSSSSSVGPKTITALAAHPDKPYFVSTATDGWLRVWPYADSHFVHRKSVGKSLSDVNYWASEVQLHKAPQHLHCATEMELTAADGWRRHAICLAFSPFSHPADQSNRPSKRAQPSVEATVTNSKMSVVDLACGLVTGDIVIVNVSDDLDLRVHVRVRPAPAQSVSTPGITNPAAYTDSPAVYALSYSPDGSWLAAASARLTVILDARSCVLLR